MALKFLTAREAVALIKDGDTVLSDGFLGAISSEELSSALEERFLETGAPKNLTLIYAAAQGDGGEKGLNHLGHPELLGRVIGGHWNLVPKIQKLAVDNLVEAYNLPQGILSQLYRDIAAGKPGTISKVGLETFVDPRLQGGKLNSRTVEDIVSLMEVGGETYLRYHPHRIDVALIRGTYADEAGNISMEREALTGNVLAAAQAARNCGGIVMVQVEEVVKTGTLHPKLVQVPGICVDVVVKASCLENHMQTYAVAYNPSYAGEACTVLDSLPVMEPGIRRIIGRRALMELRKGDVVNLGIGMPEGVALAANELGMGDAFTLTVEAGQVGGVPAGGLDFGCASNPMATIDQYSQFDFYHGGGLDIAVLGMAQCDREGSVNVSKFGPRIAGCGGFIDIAQNTPRVVFCGTFTAKGLEVKGENGCLRIVREGEVSKFIRQVEQVTFSGPYGYRSGQEVLYITERAVFRLGDGELELVEIAPGIDLEQDIMARMDFRPVIRSPQIMDAKLFYA